MQSFVYVDIRLHRGPEVMESQIDFAGSYDTIQPTTNAMTCMWLFHSILAVFHKFSFSESFFASLTCSDTPFTNFIEAVLKMINKKRRKEIMSKIVLCMYLEFEA
jgi:hypothetical protein